MADRLVYFLHIPKTAGTSVVHFLRQVGGDDTTRTLLWNDLFHADPVTDQTRLVSGHLMGLFPLWARRWPVILTVVREPVARALSHVNHVRRHPDHPLHAAARGLSVRDYCRHPVLRQSVDNLQARHLASLCFGFGLLPADHPQRRKFALSPCATGLQALGSEDGLRAAAVEALDVIDAVGTADDLDRTQALFARTLRWAGPTQAERLNTAAPEQQGLADLSADDAAALRDVTRIDDDVYRHAQARMAALCAAHGIGAT